MRLGTYYFDRIMNNQNISFLSFRRYGLAAFCAINFCTGGLYVWSIFSTALAAKLSTAGTQISASDLAPVFGLASGLTPFMMLAGGFVNDRFGPKWVIGAGGAALGAGYLLTAVAGSTFELYCTYGIFIGIGTGLVNGCTINTAVKYFPEHRGAAGGIVTASLGIGAAVLPFATQSLISAWGVDAALRSFGLVSALLIVTLAMMTRAIPPSFTAASIGKTVQQPTVSKTPLEMMRSPTFLPLGLLFMTSATLGLMMLSNVGVIAREQIGLSLEAAAASIAVISIANTIGRFISGAASDTIGRLPALVFSLLLALGGIVLLMSAGTGDVLSFYAALAGIGICFGAFIGIYPSLVADEYGPKHNSVNFSILMLGYSAGGLIGPLLMTTAGASGSFSSVYIGGLVLCALGLTFAAVYRFIRSATAAKTVSADGRLAS